VREGETTLMIPKDFLPALWVPEVSL